MVIGYPSLISCVGIFRDYKGYHCGSFCAYLGEGKVEFAEFFAVMVIIEKAFEFGWNKLWLESDCITVVNALIGIRLYYSCGISMVSWNIKFLWLKCRVITLNIDFMITHIYR